MAISFQLEHQLSLKNAWLPPIFFLDSDSPCWDLVFPHSHNLRKNIIVLVGKFLKRPEMRSTYAQQQKEAVLKRTPLGPSLGSA